MKIIVA